MKSIHPAQCQHDKHIVAGLTTMKKNVYEMTDVLTMRMNGDQERRAGKLVAVSSGGVAPAFPGALCAALGMFYG